MWRRWRRAVVRRAVLPARSLVLGGEAAGPALVG